jgi:hypothetical protein
VIHHHGTWSAALEAAGVPRHAREHELPRQERVASAIALRAAGLSVRAIADELGVDLRTAYRYLAAAPCSGCGVPALYGERCLQCAPRNAPAATPEEITAALRAWTAEHGAPPRSVDWTAHSSAWRDGWPQPPGGGSPRRLGDGVPRPAPNGAMNAHPHDHDGQLGTIYILCRPRQCAKSWRSRCRS